MNPSSNGATLLSDRTYTILRLLVTFWLPALGTLWMTVANIWNIPGSEPVLMTIVALTTFLGALVGVSQKIYNSTGAKYDGTVTIKTDPEHGTTSLLCNVPADLEEWTGKQEIVLKMTPR